MRKTFLVGGFVLASVLAMWPAWPAWVSFDSGDAAVITVASALTLLSALAAKNPLSSVAALLLPAVGWAASVHFSGPEADMLGWASAWIATLVFALMARWCLAQMSRQRHSVAQTSC